VSAELAAKINLELEQLTLICQEFQPLTALSPEAPVGIIERSAACAMLHSFYTEIEKMLKLIAQDWDDKLPSSSSWHRDLLIQMSSATRTRPAVLTAGLVSLLDEFLGFRHLFRGASIVLMRWDKLHPLVTKVGATHQKVEEEISAFLRFLETRPPMT
jgi:hypothetical protein